MADEEAVVPNILDEYEITELQVGDYTFRGDELIRLEAPYKGRPAWMIIFDKGIGEEVLHAAGVGISFLGKKKVQPVVEEAEDEPSADE